MTANPVSGEVVYAGTGATAADFPANSAGKIVLMDQAATTAARTTQVDNAIAAGAIAVILASHDGQQRRHPCRPADDGDALGARERAGDGRRAARTWTG